MTGLARSTVGARVDALLAAGLLTPSGEAASTGGRPPARLRLQPRCRRRHRRRPRRHPRPASPSPTCAAASLAEKALRPRHRRPAPRPVLDRVARAGRDAARRPPGAPATTSPASASACPAPSSTRPGGPCCRRSCPGWDGYDVPGHIGRALGGPVLVDNDVNLMALGEHATVYPDVEHLIFVKVATGIGAGIISGGRLHRGAQGAAGDLGHVAALHGGDTPCTLRQRRLPRGGRERPGRRAGVARAAASTPATAAASSSSPSRATSRAAAADARGRPRDRARARDLRQPAQPVGHRGRRAAGPVGREPAGRHPRGRLRPLAARWPPASCRSSRHAPAGRPASSAPPRW